MEYINIEELVGKTFKDVTIDDHKDVILFTTTDGIVYKMFHQQDCCESVSVEDVIGDLEDLVGTPIINAEEATNSEDDMGANVDESFTWTFYKFSTIKGYVTIRWLGQSNGYYSERVSLCKL